MPITITRHIIRSSAALEAVEAAVAKGRERGVAVVAAVADIAGDLIACLRADGAFSASVTIARDKAYTAAVFGASTDDLSNALKDNPTVHQGIALRPGVVLFGRRPAARRGRRRDRRDRCFRRLGGRRPRLRQGRRGGRPRQRLAQPWRICRWTATQNIDINENIDKLVEWR